MCTTTGVFLLFIGFSMIFCGVFGFALKKVNKWVGLIVAIALFIVFYGVPNDYPDFVGIRNIIPPEWYLKDFLYFCIVIQKSRT